MVVVYKPRQWYKCLQFLVVQVAAVAVYGKCCNETHLGFTHNIVTSCRPTQVLVSFGCRNNTEPW